jgi:prepilin-type N-terminal cleavage/methylation domain-containing protein
VAVTVTDNQAQYPHSRGFTLLELVLVLFLIGLLATAGLLFTRNIEDQAQFDETLRRLELIRKAIIQSGERTLNGQPELNGFVVDNGRLPYCLMELTGPEFDFTDSASVPDTHYQSPCSSNTALLLRKPVITDSGSRYGWWGPYIQVNPTASGDRPFTDGYNNDDGSVNFGWNWTLSESSTPVDIDSFDPGVTIPPVPFPRPLNLTVQTSGYDLNDSFDDYPTDLADFLLSENDWLLPNAFRLRFVNTSPTSAITESGSDYNWEDMRWSLTLSASGTPSQVYKNNDFSFTPPSSSIAANGGFFEYTAAVSSTGILQSDIPAGYYLVELDCSDNAGIDLDDDCPDLLTDAHVLKLMPRNNLGPIRWNIQPQ